MGYDWWGRGRDFGAALSLMGCLALAAGSLTVGGQPASAETPTTAGTTGGFAEALATRRRGLDIAVVCAEAGAAVRAAAADEAVLKRRLEREALVFLDTRRVSNGWIWTLGAERAAPAGEALPVKGWIRPDALCVVHP